MPMRLRSPRDVRRRLGGVVQLQRLAPLLCCTPPFHSGYRPGRRAPAALGAIERRAVHVSPLVALADQVVCVARPLTNSSNNAR
jgi:hypothetical protein